MNYSKKVIFLQREHEFDSVSDNKKLGNLKLTYEYFGTIEFTIRFTVIHSLQLCRTVAD